MRYAQRTITMRKAPWYRVLRWDRVAMICAIIGGISVGIYQMIPTEQPTTTYEYVVQPGDTLWSIAYKNVGEQKDVRREIYDIKFDNNINEHMRDIHPGDVLILKKPINQPRH